MRQAIVRYKEEEAGILIQHDDGTFTFRYNDNWMMNNENPAISLTLPKGKQEYHSEYLFPFFFNMLPEAYNKQLICNYYRIDENDYFSLLMTTAKNDNIGAVTISKI